MEQFTRGTFSPAQVKQLLQPIKPTRVLQAQGHSHVSQQDITAHLIRMFGFGNFDVEVVDVDLVFEEPRTDAKTGALTGRWDICYRALVRLTIRNEQGVTVAHYENGSMGTAQNQSRGDGHDLAYKSAISLSIKRAAIALGDQFGLSLYNKGQLTALVLRTLVGSEEAGEDLQAGIPQQVALGNDEIDKTGPETTAPETSTVTKVDLAAFLARIGAATTLDELNDLWVESTDGGFNTEVRAYFTAQKDFIQSVVKAEQE